MMTFLLKSRQIKLVLDKAMSGPDVRGLIFECCTELLAVQVIGLLEVNVVPDQPSVVGLGRTKISRQRRSWIIRRTL